MLQRVSSDAYGQVDLRDYEYFKLRLPSRSFWILKGTLGDRIQIPLPALPNI